MLTIAPAFFSSMPGRNALMVRCIDLTLRSKEKSQSCSEQSSTLPVMHVAGAVDEHVERAELCFAISVAIASTAAVERTSSFCRLTRS